MLLSRLLCQASCAAAAWRCSAWSLQTISPSLNATSSTQTNYALRVLRCHGLSNAALQLVYRSTVVARPTYAASAWRGLTEASDRQRINSVTDRVRRLWYCPPDLPTFDELYDTADDELFNSTVEPCATRTTTTTI